ncbi:NrfD/PsrC family molybdoenzyme membrane anchor subunit [Nitrospirota bacterium]
MNLEGITHAHGELWTVKELFVYPNEFIVWSIQIVMYPYMTGLVAGAFVLSSLYHVFGQNQLKNVATFSLAFSFCLLPVAMMPLQLHLQHPFRGIEVFFTPHFTSAIAAFGIVFTVYACIVATEIWLVYREFFVHEARRLREEGKGIDKLRGLIYSALTLGAYDLSTEALHSDHKAAKIMAAIGIPVAAFLHGYAGFIFGSVKANALWMTPLMPVIFIMSAVVSGIALCMLVYIGMLELGGMLAPKDLDRTALWIKVKADQHDVVSMTKKYLLMFLVAAISLEILDLVFRGYTAVRSWDILKEIIFDVDFVKIFVLQYFLGNFVPFIILLIPKVDIKGTIVALALILFGVFMMRWNVVIGGQAFSLTFAGFMHYHLPIIPHDLETFKEGLFGALTVIATPFVLLALLHQIIPVIPTYSKEDIE